MRICRAIIIVLMLSSIEIYAAKIVDTKDPTYKSWLYYKNASNEFNNGNYEKALTDAQRSNMFRPNKKSRKLVQQLREIGYSKVKTGTALINFNPVLAKEYLTKAKMLIEPKDKKTMAQIDDALESLEAVNTNSN